MRIEDKIQIRREDERRREEKKEEKRNYKYMRDKEERREKIEDISKEEKIKYR